MNERQIETRRGIKSRLLEAGSGAPVVYFHGVGGLFEEEPLLERLAEDYHVYAPEWPGYGSSAGEELLEDMLDFALHGWDLVDALELDARPHLMGHSMGGMITAEMACVAARDLEKLVLVAASGLWIDAHPIPDLFATLPFALAKLLFHDPSKGEALLTRGVNFSDMDALKDFMVGNARRLGTAGKILFPIPNRRVAKRLYRVQAQTLIVWGREDKLMPLAYAERWKELVPGAELVTIGEAGHMAPYEQPDAAADAIRRFLG